MLIDTRNYVRLIYMNVAIAERDRERQRANFVDNEMIMGPR